MAALKKGQPADVAAILERIALCGHFGGEEPYDADRAREIQSSMQKLKCDRVERDESVIRKRYGNRPEVLKALKVAEEW